MTLPISRVNPDEAREQAIDKNLNAATDAFGVTDGEKASMARDKVRDTNVRDEQRFTDAADGQRRRVSPQAAKLVRAPVEPIQQPTTGEQFSPNQLSGKIQA